MSENIITEYTYFISFIYDTKVGSSSEIHDNIEYKSMTLLDSYEKIRQAQKEIKRGITDRHEPTVIILNFTLLSTSQRSKDNFLAVGKTTIFN